MILAGRGRWKIENEGFNNQNEWYVNVPDIQKVALDQAIEVAQTIVDKDRKSVV